MASLWILVLVGLLMVSPARADVDCDGVDDLLTQASGLGTFLATSGWTVMTTLKATGSTTADNTCDTARILLHDVDFDFLYMGRGGTTGQVACLSMWDDVATKNAVTGTMTPGWHHLAVRWTGSALEMFVDGASTGTDSTGSITSYLGNVLQVCSTGVSGPLDRLGQLKTYNVALAPTNITAVARSKGLGFETAAPTADWRFRECADGASGNGANMFKDRSGANRHLTGDDGANNTGLVCRASEYLSLPWGPN